MLQTGFAREVPIVSFWYVETMPGATLQTAQPQVAVLCTLMT